MAISSSRHQYNYGTVYTIRYLLIGLESVQRHPGAAK